MRKNKLRLNTGGTAVLTLLQYAVHRLDYFLLISEVYTTGILYTFCCWLYVYKSSFSPPPSLPPHT